MRMKFDDEVSQKVYDSIMLGLDGYLIVFNEEEDIPLNPPAYDLLIPLEGVYPSLYTEIRPTWHYDYEYPQDPDHNYLILQFTILMYIVEIGEPTEIPRRPLTLVRTYPVWTERVPDDIALAKDWLHPEIQTADTGLRAWVISEIKRLVLEFHAERPTHDYPPSN